MATRAAILSFTIHDNQSRITHGWTRSRWLRWNFQKCWNAWQGSPPFPLQQNWRLPVRPAASLEEAPPAIEPDQRSAPTSECEPGHQCRRHRGYPSVCHPRCPPGNTANTEELLAVKTTLQVGKLGRAFEKNRNRTWLRSLHRCRRRRDCRCHLAHHLRSWGRAGFCLAKLAPSAARSRSPTNGSFRG